MATSMLSNMSLNMWANPYHVLWGKVENSADSNSSSRDASRSHRVPSYAEMRSESASSNSYLSACNELPEQPKPCNELPEQPKPTQNTVFSRNVSKDATKAGDGHGAVAHKSADMWTGSDKVALNPLCDQADVEAEANSWAGLWGEGDDYSNDPTFSDISAQLAADTLHTAASSFPIGTGKTEDAEPDPNGPLPSIGSAAHFTDSCRPCLFAHTRIGCREGENCTRCHFTHCGQRRARPSKGKRDRYRKLIERSIEEMHAEKLDN